MLSKTIHNLRINENTKSKVVLIHPGIKNRQEGNKNFPNYKKMLIIKRIKED